MQIISLILYAILLIKQFYEKSHLCIKWSDNQKR